LSIEKSKIIAIFFKKDFFIRFHLFVFQMLKGRMIRMNLEMGYRAHKLLNPGKMEQGFLILFKPCIFPNYFVHY